MLHEAALAPLVQASWVHSWQCRCVADSCVALGHLVPSFGQQPWSWPAGPPPLYKQAFREKCAISVWEVPTYFKPLPAVRCGRGKKAWCYHPEPADFHVLGGGDASGVAIRCCCFLTFRVSVWHWWSNHPHVQWALGSVPVPGACRGEGVPAVSSVGRGPFWNQCCGRPSQGVLSALTVLVKRWVVPRGGQMQPCCQLKPDPLQWAQLKQEVRAP